MPGRVTDRIDERGNPERQRHAQGRQTVLYISDREALGKEYGGMFRRLLERGYTALDTA